MPSKKFMIQMIFYATQIEFLTQVYIRLGRKPDQELLEWVEQQRLRLHKHFANLSNDASEKAENHMKKILYRMDHAAFKARVSSINRNITLVKKRNWLRRQLHQPTTVFTIGKR